MQSPIDPKLLLEHSGWMRGLAVHLLADSHRADDAVQDAWVAALESRGGPVRNLKAWLSGVVHNKARQAQRGDSRRRSREQSVARPESTAGVADTLETFALHREVVDAVQALGSPDREIVVLRYFENVPPRQVAERLNLTSGAVRSRLTRSLERLRESLDNKHDGRRGNWAPAMAAWAAKVPAGATAASGPSALVLALGAAAVVATLAVGIHLAGGKGAQPEETSQLAATIGPDLTPASPAQSSSTGGPARLAGQSRAALTQAADGGPTPAANLPLDSEIRGRVVDMLGTPLAETRVVLRRSHVEAITGRDGEFWLKFAWSSAAERNHQDVYLDLTGPGLRSRFHRVQAEWPASMDLGDIVCEPGGTVVGRVVDPKGRPVAGVQVFAGLPLEETNWDSETARSYGTMAMGTCVKATEADGSYTILGAPMRRVIVLAKADGGLYSLSTPFEVDAGSTVTAPDLVLLPVTPEERWGGIVFDPAGDPLNGTRVTLIGSDGTRIAPPSFSDGSGAFQIVARRGSDHHWRVSHPDHGDMTIQPARSGGDAELRFSAARWLVIEPRKGDGDIVRGVHAVCAKPDEYGYRKRATVLPNGDLKLRVPGDSFEVLVDGVGWQAHRLGPFLPEHAPERVQAYLEPAPVVLGQVEHGDPSVALTSVHLHASLDPSGQLDLIEGRLLQCGLPTRVDPRPLATAQLDEHGLFTLELNEPGSYELHVQAGRGAPLFHRVFRWGGESPVDLGKLEVPLAGAIEGTLQVDGIARGWFVLATSGTGHTSRTHVGRDGDFRLEALEAGRWFLIATTESSTKNDNHLMRADFRAPGPWTEVIVNRDETTHCTISPHGPAPVGCSLEGRLDFGLATELFRTGVLRSRLEVAPISADTEGRFLARVRGAGPCSLEFRGNYTASISAFFATRITLDAEPTQWDFTPPTGSIELKGLPLAKSTGASGQLEQRRFGLYREGFEWPEGFEFRIEIDPGSESSVRLEGVPEGTYSVRASPTNPSLSTRSGSEVSKVVVQGGTLSTLNLEQ